MLIVMLFVGGTYAGIIPEEFPLVREICGHVKCIRDLIHRKF